MQVTPKNTIGAAFAAKKVLASHAFGNSVMRIPIKACGHIGTSGYTMHGDSASRLD